MKIKQNPLPTKTYTKEYIQELHNILKEQGFTLSIEELYVGLGFLVTEVNQDISIPVNSVTYHLVEAKIQAINYECGKDYMWSLLNYAGFPVKFLEYS